MHGVLVVTLLLVTGCVSIDYLGKNYPPTTNVDVYFDAADVRVEYEVMGEVSAEAGLFNSTSDMQEKIVAETKKRGADGVIFGSLEKHVKGTTTKEETSKDGRVTTTTSSIEEAKIVKARLIKYRTP